jgi:hypothetical protein
MIAGGLTAFGLGFLYLISAIPAGVAAHAPLWIAALAAWVGYTFGGTVVILAGTPLREWLLTRMKIDPTPDPTKLFWRIWHRFGLWGLGLIAPVTIGPQVTAALALALGESPRRIQVAISLGVLPWVILFSILTHLGFHH